MNNGENYSKTSIEKIKTIYERNPSLLPDCISREDWIVCKIGSETR